MIDRKAFRTLSSGLYVISAVADGHRCGCVVNTLVQVASEPATLAVSLNKENTTTAAILASGRFAASALAQDVPMELIGTFGFHSSADTDKFAACTFGTDDADVPYLIEHALARFSLVVTETIDVGSHYLFVGTVEEADVLDAGVPLTYADYHLIKGGKTPPRAATYNEGDDGSPASVEAAAAAVVDAVNAAEAGECIPGITAEGCATDSEGKLESSSASTRIGWRCTICGWVEEGYPEGLPADYVCPICGATRDMFERIEL